MASTGVASTRMTLVAYSDQMKSGSRNQVSPGARSLWVVIDEVQPGEDRAEARDEDPRRHRHHMRSCE